MTMTPREILAAFDVAQLLKRREQRDLLTMMAVATHDPKQAEKMFRDDI